MEVTLFQSHTKEQQKNACQWVMGSELVTFSNTAFHKINYYHKYILLYS